VGTNAFSNVAGELRQAASGANTLIEGDVNGDGAADFSILLKGTYSLGSGDFNL
jgi:serralysin